MNVTTNSIVLLDLTPLTSYVIQISGATREGRIGERRTEVFTTDGAGKWNYYTPLLSPVNINPTSIRLSIYILVPLIALLYYLLAQLHMYHVMYAMYNIIYNKGTVYHYLVTWYINMYVCMYESTYVLLLYDEVYFCNTRYVL